MKRRNLCYAALCLVSLTTLPGCLVTSPTVDVVEPTHAKPEASRYIAAQNGAIFQSASYRPLYETYRARMVGDIVTVNINEKISAKQETTSSIAKTGGVSGTIAAVP